MNPALTVIFAFLDILAAGRVLAVAMAPDFKRA